MQAGTKRELLIGSRPNILVGTSHHPTNLKALGNRLQVNIGKTGTSTTTKGKTMKKPQVAIREDACLSLVEGTMTSTGISTALMAG